MNSYPLARRRRSAFMTWALAGHAMTLSAGAAAARPSPLMRYVGRDRVVVISAPNPSSRALQQQDASLRDDAGLRERDLVVLHAIGRRAPADALRGAVHLDAAQFGLALVGKDGEVKLKSHHPVSAETLFATIDAMPMRRREMDRKPD